MLNKIILMGRLTKDPELRRTQSGLAVTTVTLAVERDYNTSNTEKITDFIDVVAWRQTAEFICHYFAKGRVIVVEGSMQSRKWKDKDGQNRTNWEVQANHVWFGDSKRGDTSNTSDERDATPGPQYTEAEDDGDLPF